MTQTAFQTGFKTGFFIDTDDFFVLNESSAKVTVDLYYVSCILHSFSKAASMLSEDFRLFLMLFLSFLGDALLLCCFPTSFNSCEQLKVLNLQKLLVPSNMY